MEQPIALELTDRDMAQLASRAISPEDAAAQLQLLRNPPRAIVIDRPCTVGDGIVRLASDDEPVLLAAADEAIAAGRVTKFVPASGAATRMFADLLTAEAGEGRPADDPALRTFFEQLDRFAFAAELRERSGATGAADAETDQRKLLRTLLYEMGYASLPKALIPFHRNHVVRTPFEEHLLEGLQYARAADGTVRIHFTVAPDARDAFRALLREVAPRVEAEGPGARLEVTFSEQHPSTDTLAIAPDGQPFRAADGTLLFRPGGHGALLRNLQELGGDLVVIKNIDNVVPYEASREVVHWKRLLIGQVATLQKEICRYVSAVSASDADDDRLIDDAIGLAERLGRRPRQPLADRQARRAFVLDALNRPLRVCGVVRNEGEPGGAPFWIVEPGGSLSKQIVESSQVDMDDPEQRRLFESATHFNPVDIACAVRACDGTPFVLERYVDRSAVFLARKTHDGRELIALERPGLWNGGMAGWNTVFVEVPASTFAPVKTVFDLLRPQHQRQSL